MLSQSPSRLLDALRRLGQGLPSPEGSDAELLGRFVERRDEAAFEAILRRHGDMVLRTCRRHLGSGPDAEDAFQAVFLILARDAVRIGNRESLAGWLFRVAFHVSRKLMGRNARRRTVPIRDEACSRPAKDEPVDRDDLRNALVRDINSLPDRLRAPVILCYLEGHSNSEAAALLGVPKGTIDSRLSTARRKLRVRLAQRGFTLGTGIAAFESFSSAEGTAAVPGLLRRTLEAVMASVTTGKIAGVVSRQVLTLVAGVSCTMSNHRLSLILIAALLLAMAGGTGATVFRAQADGGQIPPPDKSAEKQKPAAQQKASPPVSNVPTSLTREDVFDLLQRPLGMDKDPEPMTLRELLGLLQEKFGIPIRIDIAAFGRTGFEPTNLYEQQVRLVFVRGMTLADALRDTMAQVHLEDANRQVSYRIRNGQIAIVPAFAPVVLSVGSGNPDETPVPLSSTQIMEQEEGEPISLSVEERPFSDVLRELRISTGANIVLDARHKDKAKLAVTATLHDVRLMAALRVLGDMCELQPVSLNNVFYVTSKENAEKLQQEIDRRRYGDRCLNGPFGAANPNVGFGGMGFGMPGVGGQAVPSPGGPAIGGGAGVGWAGRTTPSGQAAGSPIPGSANSAPTQSAPVAPAKPKNDPPRGN